uniref:Endonuclease/exonuclease/phosphatase domain-containing protein n=1 Tax=Latimeria chalumnae TaxID=7897 RepID=H2ZTY1_LATCH
GYEGNHGGQGYGERNTEGENVLRMAQAHNLAVVDTYFKKQEHYLVTYRSGNTQRQIDYILVKRQLLKRVKNCKVILGECLTGQHRLLVMDYKTERAKKNKAKLEMERKIKWWCLKEKFTEQVADNWRRENWEGTASEMWNKMARGTLTVAEGTLGISKGGRLQEKETWWWNEDVQEVTKDKKIKFKRWQKARQKEDFDEYIIVKRQTKRVVAKAKAMAYAELYQKLDSREGEKMVYRIA